MYSAVLRVGIRAIYMYVYKYIYNDIYNNIFINIINHIINASYICIGRHVLRYIKVFMNVCIGVGPHEHTVQHFLATPISYPTIQHGIDHRFISKVSGVYKANG